MMAYGAGLVAAALLLSLGACRAAAPQGAALLATRGGTEGQAVPVDQALQPPGPAVSREHSVELDRAASVNSNAALIVYLMRHPGDRFNDMARTFLNGRQIPDSPEALAAAAGDQAELVAAFDKARLSRSDAAWQDFLARYGDSPLAAEVPMFR